MFSYFLEELPISLNHIFSNKLHSKFWGGGRVGGLRMCHPPYHPLDFHGKIKNFCHPTLQKIRSKITVTPPPPQEKDKVKITVHKKWGPRTSTILQIYKQYVLPIFQYGSLSAMTTSDTIISKIQRLQNKFIRLALHLPKYISAKLLHDSSGLPYVKHRLLSCATRP